MEKASKMQESCHSKVTARVIFSEARLSGSHGSKMDVMSDSRNEGIFYQAIAEKFFKWEFLNDIMNFRGMLDYILDEMHE